MKHLKWYGFLYILGTLFLGSWVGQWWSMRQDIRSEGWDYFWAATMENWQSEFLQLLVQALGMVVVAHVIFKKSTEEADRIEQKIDRIGEYFWGKTGWSRRVENEMCSAWDPPEGIGRDTHVCQLRPKNHEGDHECKCGHRWGWRRR